MELLLNDRLDTILGMPGILRQTFLGPIIFQKQTFTAPYISGSY